MTNTPILAPRRGDETARNLGDVHVSIARSRGAGTWQPALLVTNRRLRRARLALRGVAGTRSTSTGSPFGLPDRSEAAQGSSIQGCRDEPSSPGSQVGRCGAVIDLCDSVHEAPFDIVRVIAENTLYVIGALSTRQQDHQVAPQCERCLGPHPRELA